MKKIIKLISITLFVSAIFFIFKINRISAESNAICRVSQGSKSKDFALPFTWYTVKVVNKPMSTPTYTISTLEITSELQCRNMNYTPTKNISSWTETQYGYQISGSTDYDKALSIFTGYFGVSLSITETQGATIKGTYIMLDETPPTMVQNGWSGAYITNINNPIQSDTIKSLIKAVDDTDGEVDVYIKNDEYKDKKHIVGGPYNITFGAIDSKGNDSELTIQVYVKDTTSPSITGKNHYENYMSSPLSLNTLKSNLIATDNYDTNTSITLIENNWSPNSNKTGTYTIIYQAIDSSTNKSEKFTISITNYDDVSPTISGETTYNVSNSSQISLDYIKENLLVADNCDSNPSINISLNNYTLNKDVPGTYDITFYASDSSGNNSNEIIVKVTVFDNIAPVFYISGKFIAIESSTLLSITKLKEIIATANNINYADVTDSIINYNYYSDNHNTPGEYQISLLYTLNSGEQKNIIQNIKVVDSFSQETPISNKKEEQTSFFQKIWKVIINFFTTIWNYIKYFFSFKWL